MNTEPEETTVGASDLSALLGCPFCGKAPQITKDGGSYGYTPPSVRIKCCDIFMKEDTERWEQGKGHFSVEKQARSRLTERWNKRAT